MPLKFCINLLQIILTLQFQLIHLLIQFKISIKYVVMEENFYISLKHELNYVSKQWQQFIKFIKLF
jgi:hypothetical protein